MQQKSIFVQVSAGRGPAECAWVVAQVVKVLLGSLKHNGLACEVISRNQGPEAGTLNSCLLKVTGKQVVSSLNPWVGTIQWIGKSTFRKFHKRKNWFVGVTVFTEQALTTFDERDLVFSTFRSSGPGGQHRNKVETAVRVVHEPTQIAVSSSDSKSQVQNRKAAIAKMKKVLEQKQMEHMQAQVDEQWKEHLSLSRGNPVKVFEGRDFKEKKP